MRVKILILPIALLLISLKSPAQEWPCTYWFNYMTLEENLPVATSPDFPENHPTALPYPEGSILVVFFKGDTTGICYQIINRYGQKKYPEPQCLHPDFGTGYVVNEPYLISDGEGGALAYWRHWSNSPLPGMWAQRLDSLGNLCWGDSAKRISPFDNESDFCPDGYGGFFAAFTQRDYSHIPHIVDIWLQYIDSEGQIAWGDSGKCVLSDPWEQAVLKVVADGHGGVYLCWFHAPGPYASIYMQRYDCNGNPVWEPAGGLYLCDGPVNTHAFPDGEGGFILQTGTEGRVYRVGPNGNILWSQQYVSWHYEWQMVPGEPGFFYTGWIDDLEPYVGFRSVYGQRFDIEGNIYWPTYGSGRVGALMANFDDLTWGTYYHFAFRYPYFFGIYYFLYNPGQGMPFRRRSLYIQALNIEGERQFGDNGTLIAFYTQYDSLVYQFPKVVPDEEGGAAGIWGADNNLSSPQVWDIYAKHVNADGTLGGPKPVKIMPPINPCILGANERGIHYEIPSAGMVKLEMFDVLGRRVKTLLEEFRQAGAYSLSFDRENFASGIYFIRLKTPLAQQVAKMVVVK